MERVANCLSNNGGVGSNKGNIEAVFLCAETFAGSTIY